MDSQLVLLTQDDIAKGLSYLLAESAVPHVATSRSSTTPESGVNVSEGGGLEKQLQSQHYKSRKTIISLF